MLGTFALVSSVITERQREFSIRLARIQLAEVLRAEWCEADVAALGPL
jgi:hypothetical protein